MFPYSALFSTVDTYLCLSTEASFTTAPCIWLSCSVLGVRLWITSFWNSLGHDFRIGFRMQHSLVRLWIHVGVSQ